MQTLLELDAEAPGSLAPELAASVCALDRDLVLELITWNSQEEIAWRAARGDEVLQGDPEAVEVCDMEAGHAEAMVTLLRRALRLIVDRQMRLDFEDRGCLTAGRRRPGPGRRARAAPPPTEPAAESVVPEES